jgi:hypothetical protein
LRAFGTAIENAPASDFMTEATHESMSQMPVFPSSSPWNRSIAALIVTPCLVIVCQR